MVDLIRKRHSWVWLTWICAVLLTETYAQSLNLRNYDPRSGLSATETYFCMQDSKGYIWIASDAGVNRFDGEKFTRFTKADGLADNTVFTIYEDSRHRIWFVSYSGGISYYLNGRIHAIAANEQLQQMINYQNEVVVSFEVDRGDTIWVSHNFRSSYIKIPPAGNWKRAETAPGTSCERSFVFVNKSATPLYTSGASFANGDCISIVADGTIHSMPLPGGRTDVPTYVRLLPVSGNEFFFSVFDRLFHVRSNRIVAHKNFGARIIALCADRSKNLWVGVYQHGVYRHNGFDLATTMNYFGNISVTHVLEDHENGFWFTTLEKGAFYTPSVLLHHLDLPTRDESITALGAQGDKLYAGTTNGELAEITALPDSGFRITNRFDAAHNYMISSITPDHDGLFVNVRRLFKYSFDGATRKEVRVAGEQVSSRHVTITGDSIILIPTLYNLLQVDRKGRLLRKDSFPSRLTHANLLPDGRLYVGCMNGLWQIKNGTKFYLGKKTPSLASPVSGIATGNEGDVWVSTRGGGVTCIGNDTVRVFDSSSGGISDHCTCLTADDRGRIWVGSNAGLFRIDASDGFVRRFDRSNGLRTNEIKSVLCFSGHLFIASALGLDLFDLAEELSNEVAPPVHINGLLVNQQNRLPADGTVLKHSENNLELSFSGFSYKSEHSVRYRYMLHGYDADWTLTDNKNARYTNLPAGSYTFEVFAINHEGIQSSLPARMGFKLSAAWWMNRWIIGAGIVATLGGFASAAGLLFRRARRRQQKKAQIDQLLIESRLTALRAQMNPHFIFNVINSIQHFILLNDKDKAYDYLARFSRLIRIVLDNSQYTTVSLETEVQLLTLYMDLEKLRFEKEFEYEIAINTKSAPSMIALPNMLLQPYVENAIIHGVAPKKSGGKIRVSFEEEETLLRVTITDNGVGRARSRELRKRSTHRSAGMLITEERIKTLGELISSRINVLVRDLVDADGQPAGTHVELLIPIF